MAQVEERWGIGPGLAPSASHLPGLMWPESATTEGEGLAMRRPKIWYPQSELVGTVKLHHEWVEPAWLSL